MGEFYCGAGSLKTKIGQGDIIHQPRKDDSKKPRWGFIVTADCDIAQDKAGARLSYLEIITVHDFLENFWAAETLRKLRTRALAKASELVTSAAKYLDSQFDAVSPEDIILWLGEASGEEIIETLKIPSNKKNQYRETLKIVELIFDIRGANATALQRLFRIWAIQGTGPKEMRLRLAAAVDHNKATDFHLIPAIPGFESLGYIVLLREVFSIKHEDIYASMLDLQICGSEDGYYVAGPSVDNLRYAISQKMAFLFSRIGMSEEYESNCEIVKELAIDELSSFHNLTGTNQ